MYTELDVKKAKAILDVVNSRFYSKRISLETDTLFDNYLSSPKKNECVDVDKLLESQGKIPACVDLLRSTLFLESRKKRIKSAKAVRFTMSFDKCSITYEFTEQNLKDYPALNPITGLSTYTNTNWQQALEMFILHIAQVSKLHI